MRLWGLRRRAEGTRVPDGICLSLQVMGVEREAEPQFEVAACLVQPALFVFDDAE
jgi:hypothetical protein